MNAPACEDGDARFLPRAQQVVCRVYEWSVLGTLGDRRHDAAAQRRGTPADPRLLAAMAYVRLSHCAASSTTATASISNIASGE